MSRSRLVCMLLVIGTMLVYLPVRNHEFVNYDDPGFLTDNPAVQAGTIIELTPERFWSENVCHTVEDEVFTATITNPLFL